MKHYQCADDVKITNVNVRDEKKMGMKQLRKIEQIFKNNPDKYFVQSFFTNYENIDYRQALLALQYLWDHKIIVLTPEGYIWNKKNQK